jgi:hypothetical protein
MFLAYNKYARFGLEYTFHDMARTTTYGHIFSSLSIALSFGGCVV